MPQYCRDKGIKKPLIVSYDSDFLWELSIQFRYDKGLFPVFQVFGDRKNVNYGSYCTAGGQHFETVDFGRLDRYDRIIVLTTNRYTQFPDEKTIYFERLLKEISQYVYAERPVYEFMRRHPGVAVLVTNVPLCKRDGTSTEIERNMESIHAMREKLKRNRETIIETQFDRFGYSNAEVLRMLELTGAVTEPDGSTRLNDNEDPLVGVRDGSRQTAYQEKEYAHTIYCMGTCTYYGIGAPWNKTVESYLQKIMNDNGEDYRVENASQFFSGRYQDIFYNLDRLPVKPDDLVLICLQGLSVSGIPFYDVSGLFDRPHDYGEVFADDCHLNENGYRVLAEKIYVYLKEHCFFTGYQVDGKSIPQMHPVHLYGIPENADEKNFGNGALLAEEHSRELALYKKQLQEMRPAIGSIVMNCNPFTMGHRYLVEYAAGNCAHLFLFVVEEDRSIFPFKDRLEMVKEGTKDLRNVTVLPSGKFVISQMTFAEYFNKESLQEEEIDPSLDVELFAREIAPALGITVRFAGMEPFDRVTAQYNESMGRILPKYGIAFVEIPRKEIDGDAVSASRVRELMREHDYRRLKKLVPKTTLRYLRQFK